MFLNTPLVCEPYQRDRRERDLYYAGQICGVEGYVECILSGLVSALSLAARLEGVTLPPFPTVTMTGALMDHIHTPTSAFQPMNANMGILPVIAGFKRRRRERYHALSSRAIEAMRGYRMENSRFF
jgi:methylenetetrahydrofolate--tRNA-(uracil-5-)-methyltransferase